MAEAGDGGAAGTHRALAGRPRRSARRLRRRPPWAAFRADFDAARGCFCWPCVNLSRQHIATVAARRASVSPAGFARRAAQREGRRSQRLRDAIAPVRLGKKPGRGCGLEQQQMIGALRHRCRQGVGNRDQRRAGLVRGARRQHARRGIRRKADDDHGIAGTKRAEIEILRAGAADQLHRVGPEQAKLIVEQFRHAAAAAKTGDPDTSRVMQRPAAAAIGAGARCAQGRRPRLRACRRPARHRNSVRGARFGAAGERRGRLRPPRLGQRSAQAVPARIAERLGKPGEGGRDRRRPRRRDRASSAWWRRNHWRRQSGRPAAAAPAMTAAHCTAHSAARISVAAEP